MGELRNGRLLHDEIPEWILQWKDTWDTESGYEVLALIMPMAVGCLVVYFRKNKQHFHVAIWLKTPLAIHIHVKPKFSLYTCISETSWSVGEDAVFAIRIAFGAYLSPKSAETLLFSLMTAQCLSIIGMLHSPALWQLVCISSSLVHQFLHSNITRKSKNPNRGFSSHYGIHSLC